MFTTRGSVGEIYASVAHAYGSKAEADAIQAAFLREFRGDGPISVHDEKRWWKDIVHRVFTEVGMVEKFDEFFERVYDTFRNSQGWMLFPETLEVLNELKGLGLKLGVISNFDSRAYTVLESLGIRHFFDAVTLSSEAGYSKPDAGIFEAAVRALALPASTILLVGDSLHDDVEPAIRLGLPAVLIDRKGRYTSSGHVPSISSLNAVISEVRPSGGL